MNRDPESDRQLPWAEILKRDSGGNERQPEISRHLGDKIHQLEAQVRHLDVALVEARRLHQSMTQSLSWRVTWPLRILRDALANLNSVRQRVGPSLPATKVRLNPHAVRLAASIRGSGFFDTGVYEATAEARAQGLDPALHYVLIGEKRGLKPSLAFDPVYYGERYQDVAAWGGNRLDHYIQKGQVEGRRALPLADTLTLSTAGIKTDRPTILILVHEASRSGAPILGWNIVRALCGRANVVAILLQGGPLKEPFADIASAVVGPTGNDINDQIEASRLARRLVQVYQPLYVIANSVATRSLVPALTDEGIPVLALAHEFSSYMGPAGSLQLLYERAAEIVFPAEIVRRASEADYPSLRLRRTHVLAQGPSEVPRSPVPTNDLKRAEVHETARSRLRPGGADDDLVVVGMGPIEWRKGVDFFIATATAILAHKPEAPVRFAWIGGYLSPMAVEVSSFVSEQITRSGLGGRFQLMDAVEDIEIIYQEADVLFLSSRLDPLPNVSIDATLRGIPVVCFADASGMAEILASNDETRELVVPHLDVGAAAELIGSLATDNEKLNRLGDAVREVAQVSFDMEAYVNALDELGRRAKQANKQKEADAALILAEGAFDLPLYLGERATSMDLAAAVREYSEIAGKYDYLRAPAVHQACTRRPLAGFHPVTYALQKPNYDARRGGDPLAHYLRTGRPKGPWVHHVIRIETRERTARPTAITEPRKLRVVLHGHFHYTDHVDEFMRALAVNKHSCELILTTNSTDKADEIRSALKKSRAEGDIQVVPNRGRDIGPFLNLLEKAIGKCDLLGHVHGKRSPHAEKGLGDRWRIYLWQHLIGDELPMLDTIERAFAEDPTLGLVFPEDPFLIMWDKNLNFAADLAARMGLRAPLPACIECPVGTMFWARPEALAPLLRLRLTWDDYPPEPLPIDGTILHALERLIPLIAEHAGYHYATIYLPGVIR